MSFFLYAHIFLYNDLITAIKIVIWTMAICSMLLAIVLFVYALFTLKERYLTQKATRKTIEAKSLTTIHAPHDHQIFVMDSEGKFTPLHLDYSREWGYWHNLQAKEIKGEPMKQMLSPIQPVLPRLIEAQRLILAGPTGVGKSTIIKFIIANRSDSLIIPIDPHSPSRILGYDVIGAGRDFVAIGDALETLILLMTARYGEVAQGIMGYQEHERISVFIDEWTSIRRKVPHAGDNLATLLTESRKVNIHLTICSHSATVEALGLPDAQIRKSATIVELTNDRKAFIDKVEYSLPGPFPDYVAPQGQVIKSLPNSQTLKAQILKAQGFSDTAIAREVFGVEQANSSQINKVRKMYAD